MYFFGIIINSFQAFTIKKKKKYLPQISHLKFLFRSFQIPSGENGIRKKASFFLIKIIFNIFYQIFNQEKNSFKVGDITSIIT